MMQDNLKQHVGYWLNRARMTVHVSFEKSLSNYDITVAQWCILVSLYDQQSSSIKELADYIEVDKASISRVVERLVSKRLVAHSQGKDRRSGHVQLTDEGAKLVPKLINVANEGEKHFFGFLTEEEQKVMRKTLQYINSL